jgi:hypothetical protein
MMACKMIWESFGRVYTKEWRLQRVSFLTLIKKKMPQEEKSIFYTLLIKQLKKPLYMPITHPLF